jgi:hypothetical protein
MTSLVPNNNPLSSDSTTVVFNVNVEDLYGTSDNAERNEAPILDIVAKDIARNPATSDDTSMQVQTSTSYQHRE